MIGSRTTRCWRPGARPSGGGGSPLSCTTSSSPLRCRASMSLWPSNLTVAVRDYAVRNTQKTRADDMSCPAALPVLISEAPAKNVRPWFQARPFQRLFVDSAEAHPAPVGRRRSLCPARRSTKAAVAVLLRRRQGFLAAAIAATAHPPRGGGRSPRSSPSVAPSAPLRSCASIS